MRIPNLRFQYLTVILFLLPCWRTVAADDRPAGPDYPTLGREVVKIIRDNFFDAQLSAAWAKRHADFAAGIRTEESFSKLTNDLIAELKTSHTHYYPQSHPGYWGLAAVFGEYLGMKTVEYVSIGADTTDRGFVRTVFSGSPAEKAGLLRGDRILAVDGRPFEPIESFAAKEGASVTLTIERQGGGQVMTVSVVPRRINPKAEWLAALDAGARILSREGVDVAYAPLFWGAGDETMELMRELIAVRFRDADALILDFRKGWGGCNPDFVNFFNAAPPHITLIDRDGKKQSYDPQWRKPLVLLINGGSRSGKEIVANTLKREKLATLVGERTAGFVIGGRPFLLSDRSLLYVAVMDTLVDGERLEGVGVAPDVLVQDQLEYAAGKDPQLERAIELAVEKCRNTPPPPRP